MFHQDAPIAAATQDPALKYEPARCDRAAQAALIDAFEQSGRSQLAFCRDTGLPRSTLRHWLRRKHALDADHAVIAFFSSSAGLAFLHRLVLAVHFVFGLLALDSSRHIETFLRMAGLAGFVASSKTVAHQTQQQILEQIQVFEQEQRHVLTQKMKADLAGDTRPISLCVDETFHPQTCMVAIEPVSNFILLETYAEDRKAPTWILTAREALKGLPVQLVQVVADGARALGAMAEHFGAHLSPDLMHILQPTVRGVLSAATRKAQAASVEDKARLEEQLERLHKGLEEIEQGYHPVDVSTGQWMSAAQGSARIQAGFEAVESVIAAMGLGHASCQGLLKSKGHKEQMHQTLERAQAHRHEVEERLEEPQRGVAQVQMRVRYLEKMIRSASGERRVKMKEALCRLKIESEELSRVCDAADMEEVKEAVEGWRRVFERSSSCVEGRNGYLSLAHHGLRRLSERRLRAQTVLHNYFIRRSDGTTAAERFFGHKHSNLFEYLLDRVDYPAWPGAQTRAC